MAKKLFAFVKQDASSVQKTTELLIAHTERNPKTLNACYAKATI